MAMKQDIHQVSTVQRYPIGFKYPKTNPLDLGATTTPGPVMLSILPRERTWVLPRMLTFLPLPWTLTL